MALGTLLGLSVGLAAVVATRRARPRPPEPVRSTGWRGMFTTFAEDRRTGFAHFCLNCLPAWIGGPITSRPGITGLDHGSPASNTVFAIFSFTTSAGVLITGRLVKDGAAGGAHLETFNWSTNVWTVRLTAAQINGFALDLTGDTSVDWVVFNGTIVFSDGVNKPWTWDGTAGAGVVKLTNAPVAYGRPTVYYGKLFFIELANRNVIDWSEENQANTGYTAGGYNNTWALTQTGTAPLIAILGTNASLLYWRAQSMGEILGAVTPAFQATGVHDGVSATVGCGDYRSVVRYGSDTWWLDNGGRFQVRPDGGAPIDITPFDLRPSQIATVEPFGFESMGWVRPQPSGVLGPVQCLATSFTQAPGTGGGTDEGRVLFALQGSTDREWVGLLVFDAVTRFAQGYCTFPTPLNQLATLTGPSAGQVVAFSTPSSVAGAGNYLWLFGLGAVGAAAGGADATYNGTAAIACTFMDGPVLIAPEIEETITRVDLTAFVDCAQSTPAVSFSLRFVSSEYPTASVAPAAQAQSIPASGTITAYTEKHLAYGVFTVARWMRPVVQWTMGTGNEAFSSGLLAVSVDTTASARPPGLT